MTTSSQVVQLTQLPVANNVADSDLLVISQGGTTKSVQARYIADIFDPAQVPLYDNYAALRLLTPVSTDQNSIVYVEGRTTIGDGGGGFFRLQNTDPTTNWNDIGEGLVVSISAAPANWYAVRQFNGFTSPRWWGAVGEPLNSTVSTDSATALANAFRCRLPTDGEGLWYGVSGLFPSSGFTLTQKVIQNLKAKQLDPANTNPRTLRFNSGKNLTLSNIVIDQNARNTGNQNLSGAFGLEVASYTNAVINNIHVSGGAGMNGIGITQCSDIRLNNCLVENFQLSASVTDDAIQGYIFTGTDKLIVNDCIARDFYNVMSGVTTCRYTRGFAQTGLTNHTLTNCIAEFVDQGFDLTGHIGSSCVSYIGCRGINNNFWTFKAAHNNHHISYTDCQTEGNGYCGYVQSGSSIDRPYDITYSNCKAINTGTSLAVYGRGPIAYPQSTTTAFLTLPVSLAAGAKDYYPRGITYQGCAAINDANTPADTVLQYGFRSQVSASPVSVGSSADDFLLIQADRNCIVRGAQTSSFSNMHTQICEALGTGVAGVCAGTTYSTMKAWNTIIQDSAKMHDVTSNPTPESRSRFWCKSDGYYIAQGVVAFNAQISGTRSFYLMRNKVSAAIASVESSTTIGGSKRVVPAYLISGTQVPFTAIFRANQGDFITAHVKIGFAGGFIDYPNSRFNLTFQQPG